MTTRMYQGFSYMVVRGYPRVNKSRGQGGGELEKLYEGKV